MKYINLVTSKNAEYRKVFANTNFNLTEYSPEVSVDKLKAGIMGKRNSFTVLEITDTLISDFKRTCELFRTLNSLNRLIIVTKKINKPLKQIMVSSGIADCLESVDPVRLREYIKYILQESDHSFGRILIFDDTTEYKNILKTVIERLDYSCDFIAKVEDLFLSIKKNQYKLILLNLGTKGTDINQIIRKSYTDNEIRKFPIIAYKNMDEGMFVHEFLNGLNKLTKIILSPEELFSAILDLLYKKRIMTLISGLNRSLKFEKYSNYSDETISQIYYEIHRDLCDQENLFTSDHLETIHTSINEIKKTVSRIDGLRWLKNEQNRNSTLTCGLGV